MTDCRVNLISRRDLNGFFGLIADNMAIVAFIFVILVVGFKFPAEIVSLKIIPGTALGVFVGDIILTYVGYRLSKKTGRNDITAMPLGLDLPSAIGIALTVVGPAFLAMKANGLNPENAAMQAWYIGMAGIITIGVFKIAVTPFANKIQNTVPLAGLLGSLAGICVGLIGFISLVEIFSLPIVGIIALGLVIYTIIAKIPLPKRIPGVFASIIIGTVLYHVLGNFNLIGCVYNAPELSLHFALPLPSLNFIKGIVPGLKYFPIFLPFAILVIVGDINVTASAVEGGDPYRAKNILLIDGISTIIGGLCGSISQTTAYIGQPAYKHMGARLGYTLLAGIFIGLGGMFGYLIFFIHLIPSAVLAPILVFVAMDIISQSFYAPPKQHAAAVCLAIFPTIARLVAIKYTDPSIVSLDRLHSLITQTSIKFPEVLVTISMGNGFIFVGMLWGAFLAEVIDRRLKRSAIYLFILSILSFFGVIHSVNPSGMSYLPWKLTDLNMNYVYQLSLAYLILGIMFFALSFSKSVKESKFVDLV